MTIGEWLHSHWSSILHCCCVFIIEEGCCYWCFIEKIWNRKQGHWLIGPGTDWLTHGMNFDLFCRQDLFYGWRNFVSLCLAGAHRLAFVVGVPHMFARSLCGHVGSLVCLFPTFWTRSSTCESGLTATNRPLEWFHDLIASSSMWQSPLNICDCKSHSISLLGSSNGHLHDAEQFFWLQFFLVDLFRLFQTCVNYSSCYTIAQFVARCIPCIWSFSCHKHNMKYLCLIHSPCSSATMFSCTLFNTAFCGIWFSAGISVIGLHTFNIWPNLC